MKKLFMRNIRDRQVYLDRMSKPLQEKLKIIRYIPLESKSVVDVGCADGFITAEMAKLFPGVHFLGIDLDPQFIKIASKKYKDIKNLRFECIYLRELLARPERFDVLVFCSVLHEFFTYGEGISTVVKALADAHELLNKNGVVIIRDMILYEYTKRANLHRKAVLNKIQAKKMDVYINDFENKFGRLNTVYKLNHYLLKYWYIENWNREGKEHYVPVTFEQYEMIFLLLGMLVQFKESYVIEYLKNKWAEDFGFLDEEIADFKSTGIIVAQKV